MTKNELRSIVAEALGVSEDSLAEGTSLTRDLDVRSLDILRLIVRIENKYGIDIDENQIDLLDNLADAYRYVATLIAKRNE